MQKESGLGVFWHFWSVLSGSPYHPIRPVSFPTVFHSGKLPNVAKFNQCSTNIDQLQYDIPANGSRAFIQFHCPGGATAVFAKSSNSSGEATNKHRVRLAKPGLARLHIWTAWTWPERFAIHEVLEVFTGLVQGNGNT